MSQNTTPRSEIRLALPSKGRMAEEVIELLNKAGLHVYKPNPRQYRAVIPSLPNLVVLFQRSGDIITSVRDGSVDFGITGWDIYTERSAEHGAFVTLLQDLGFGYCTLNVIVPEAWTSIQTMAQLAAWHAETAHPLRVATKFPVLTEAFFQANGIADIQMISAEGTLEIAPTIGYADVIVDLVSTGTTLRDNRLKTIDDGVVLRSQACLIANRQVLKQRPEVLALARQLLEIIVAYLRAADNVSVFVNIRGDSPKSIAARMFGKSVIGGLQGPTISQVITHSDESWYAVHLVVRREQLGRAILELREIGGSGVVVSPVMYIFEEEPQAYQDMLAALED